LPPTPPKVDPAEATRKKPSPWIIMSVTTPVLWALPCVISVSIELSDMPRPTWRGLVPPVLGGTGAPAPARFW